MPGAWPPHNERAGPKRWRVFPVSQCISFFFRVGAAARQAVRSDLARHLVFLHFTVIQKHAVEGDERGIGPGEVCGRE